LKEPALHSFWLRRTFSRITILPEVTVAQDIAHGRLTALEWEEDKLEVATLMIWYKDRWLSPTLNAFMEMTRAVLSRENSKL